MFKIPYLLLLSLICMTFISCKQNKFDKSNTKLDSLELKIQFSPSFIEKSEMYLLKTDSIKFIQILIRNNFRVDEKEDTFWFRKINLSDKQSLELDTSLIEICSKKIPFKDELILDGMPVASLLIKNRDSNVIYRNSPSKKEDSIGYHYVKALIEISKGIFQDSLIGEYFDDLKGYIDDSEFQKPDNRRKIDRLRTEKYNWGWMKN